MSQRLSLRIMLPTITLLVVVFAIFGWLLGRRSEAEVRNRAAYEAEAELTRAMNSLQAADSLTGDAVHTAMRVLLDQSRQWGAPETLVSVVDGKAVPELRLGRISQVSNFALVDKVQQLTGATSTLFAKEGDDFVRVSTNVLKADGGRAVGTDLDRSGRAYAALENGAPFYGVVEILGTPYMTGYEPMRDAHGETIGAWYVGFPLKGITQLGQQMASARILDHGFIALQRPSGKVVFRSDSVTEAQVAAALEEGNSSRQRVMVRDFAPWGYKLVAAYPESDVIGRVRPIRILTIACTLSSIGLVLSVQFWLISRLVLRPLDELMKRMEDADLNTTFDENRQDEIGLLGRGFDRFVVRVRETLLEVARASRDVVGLAEKISAASRHMASSVATQKDQVAHIAAVLQDMSGTVREVSEHCGRTATSAQAAAKTAKSGGTLVADSLTHIEAVANSVGEAGERMDELGRRSEAIGRIVSVIEDIAGQTNLLALNAAIEAARAGEQGRGFAVVASEVRRLAERTGEATREIAGMIEGVQTEVRAAVGWIQSGRRDVEAGVAVTGRAGTALEEIVGDAEKVGAMAAHIASSATQQAGATEQVYERIEQIRLFAGESADGARRSASACEELGPLAGRLQELVSRFRLGDAC